MIGIKLQPKHFPTLFLFGVLYGFFFVNYADLRVTSSFHLWLILCYFAPFIPLLLLSRLKYWKEVLTLGLLSSLMNDLFYAEAAILFLGHEINLIEWYKWQFGFYWTDAKWNFSGGFFTFPVTSILMGASIYARIATILILLIKRRKNYLSQTEKDT